MEVLDDRSEAAESNNPLEGLWAFWEGKRRVWYNLLVGASGSVVVLLGLSEGYTIDYLMYPIMGYAVLANGCYFLGHLLDYVLCRFLALRAESASRWRKNLWLLGLLFSMVFTLGFGIFVLFMVSFGRTMQEFDNF